MCGRGGRAYLIDWYGPFPVPVFVLRTAGMSLITNLQERRLPDIGQKLCGLRSALRAFGLFRFYGLCRHSSTRRYAVFSGPLRCVYLFFYVYAAMPSGFGPVDRALCADLSALSLCGGTTNAMDGRHRRILCPEAQIG